MNLLDYELYKPQIIQRKLLAYKEKNLIKVVSGLHRFGNSTSWNFIEKYYEYKVLASGKKIVGDGGLNEAIAPLILQNVDIKYIIKFILERIYQS